MISRREVVTAGMLGTLSTTVAAAPAVVEGQSDPGMQAALGQIRSELQQVRSVLDDGLRGSSLSYGGIATIRERMTAYLRSSGKFPDFCEIGTSYFYEVYDWHVKHGQQIQITRLAEQRFAIQFMLTQLIVRWEQDPGYLGIPYDRG